MVEDVQAAVGFLRCRAAGAAAAEPHCLEQGAPTGTYPHELGAIPPVDPDRIYLAGFSVGGMVALHAAALDPRVAGVAAFAAFTPMRSDADGRPTGGGRRLSELHALVPRLGWFAAGSYADVPYDYDELLAALAPRPTLLYSPTNDRDATHVDVEACVDGARAAWGNQTARLQHESPEDVTRMEGEQSDRLIDWLGALL